MGFFPQPYVKKPLLPCGIFSTVYIKFTIRLWAFWFSPAFRTINGELEGKKEKHRDNTQSGSKKCSLDV